MKTPIPKEWGFLFYVIFINMKKVIRLTERDLTRLVKRVIREGESEEKYENLIKKLEKNGFYDKDGDDHWETNEVNGMSVDINVTGGFEIYSVVNIDNIGYSTKSGTLNDDLIVYKSIMASKVIKTTKDKSKVMSWLKTNGWTK